MLAGFDDPRVFSDDRGGLPPVGIFGNWWLSLVELYLRDPQADRYAIFQDDILICRNVRPYLDRLPFPDRGYWSLYAAMENDQLPVPPKPSFVPSCQRGRGALALVFSRQGVVELLSSKHFACKPQDPVRGWRTVDGAVVQALCWSELKWTEWVHLPSLVQHAGADAPTRPERYAGQGGKCPYRPAATFPGTDYDAADLLK
jgi:hypothetical protein